MIMADTETKRGLRKERAGVVISAAMDKTIVVRVERKKRHPVYGKEMRQIQKFYAHDEENKAKSGDKVLIVETRPLSKLKRWRLVKILETGEGE
jgi:small subunit ribosomal protein S17